MTKKELAQSICNLVGESNIRTIANCYTRVRLTVKDPEKMKREELKKLEGVLGVIEEGSHVQLVLGPGTAAAVAQLMSDMTHIKSEEVDEAVLLKEELYRGESFLSETVSFGKRIPGCKVVGMGIHSGDVLVMVQVGIEILIGSGAQEALDDAGYIGI